MRIDIMIDIQTLGKQSNSTIFQISAIAFNIKTGETYSQFNECINIENDFVNADGSTLRWWLKTNPELLNKLINNGSEISEPDLIVNLYHWLNYHIENVGNENVFLWGNGMLFDNAIIKSHIKACGLEYPIFYRNDRDMRTLVELASIKSGIATEKEFRDKYFDKSKYEEHNAMDNVNFQIEVLHKAYEIIIG